MNVWGGECLGGERLTIVRLGYTVPQNRAVGAQFRFQADSSEKNVQLG